MSAYYNEIDPYCCEWLRNLIAEGLIAPGEVDNRSILDVDQRDIQGFRQAHFFAGIGGWSLAIRQAGWLDERPVWTGSCPCQPFSAAGKGKAADDERHLWPAWASLIRECRPPTIFGEQVEAAVGWGWLDAVFADLEAEGYACGATVLPACSVGAPHIRQRLWFVGHAMRQPSERRAGSFLGTEAQERVARLTNGRESNRLADASEAGELADAMPAGRPEGRAGTGNGQTASGGSDGGVVHPTSEQVGLSRCARQPRSTDSTVDNATGPRQFTEGQGPEGEARDEAWMRVSRDGRAASPRVTTRTGKRGCYGLRPWADLIWLPCTDGKQRPTKPGIFPLAHGVPARVAKLRAAGNAIVPQVAAEFIKAMM